MVPAASAVTTALALLLRGASAAGTLDCMVHTGGSCKVKSCHEWRGPTTCNSARCFCPEGFCAGSDGVCSTRPYVEIGNGTVYKIKNSRWPEYYLAAQWMGGITVEKTGHDDDNNKFTLKSPPYTEGEWPEQAFIVRSRKYTDSALRIINSDGWKAMVQSNKGGLGGIGRDPSVEDFSIVLTVAPGASSDGDVPLLISTVHHPDIHIYVSQMGRGVLGYEGDPGAGGYWYFEPRLPEELRERLPRFSKERCTTHCGVVRNVDAASPLAVSGLVAMFSVVITLLPIV